MRWPTRSVRTFGSHFAPPTQKNNFLEIENFFKHNKVTLSFDTSLVFDVAPYRKLRTTNF